MVFQEFLFLTFVKELEKGVDEPTPRSSKIRLIPLKDHRDGDKAFLRENPYLRTVDKALCGQLELEIDLRSFVKTDRRAGPSPANEGKMDSWVQGKHGKGQPRVSLSEEFEQPVGMPPVFSENPVFNVVQGKSASSNLIDYPIEKSATFLHRMLKSQLDHPMDHHGIVDIDPKCQPLPPGLKGAEIEGPQSTGEAPIPLEGFRTTDGTIANHPSLCINELAL